MALLSFAHQDEHQRPTKPIQDPVGREQRGWILDRPQVGTIAHGRGKVRERGWYSRPSGLASRTI